MTNDNIYNITNDNVYKTIKQIELTKKAFEMIDDLNRVACNCLGLTEELIKKLSYDECIEVLAKCENIPISTKHDLVNHTKKLESELNNKEDTNKEQCNH